MTCCSRKKPFVYSGQDAFQVLLSGALRQVEELRILRSYELTSRSLELFLARCPRLRTLVELEGWEALPKEEVEALRNKVKEENMDLVTVIEHEKIGM